MNHQQQYYYGQAANYNTQFQLQSQAYKSYYPQYQTQNNSQTSQTQAFHHIENQYYHPQYYLANLQQFSETSQRFDLNSGFKNSSLITWDQSLGQRQKIDKQMSMSLLKNQQQSNATATKKSNKNLKRRRNKPNGFKFINLQRYWKRLTENFNLTNDQITDLQFKFDNYGEYKKWYKQGMEKINTSGDNSDCRDKDQTQEVDCCHKCSQFPINIQQQINEYKPADQNAILSRVEVSKSNEESICTNLNCKKIIKQIMQEKEDQSHQFDQRLKIVEQERDELREKCKELEQQILEIFSETINQNQQRIKQFQKNVSSDNKMKYQNQNNKKATCDDKYLLEHQSSTKRSIQEMVQDMKNGIKKKHQMKFFDWGLRQTMGDSVSYQGSILDNKLWDQVINDAKRGLIGNLFDVIVADAPWDSTAINLNYQTLSDSQFMTKIPIHRLQQNGYLFLWITNKKLEVALQYLEKIGYERIELITWIKISKENLLRDNIGFYLRHFTEFCIVARKKGKFAELSKITKTHKAPNIIVEKVTESSRKPEQLYQIIEQFCPNGKYLEIFGRVHNQREKWVTIGNEAITRKKPKQEKARRKLHKANLKGINPQKLIIL